MKRPDTLLSIREAAALTDPPTPPRLMRQRLERVNRRSGGRILRTLDGRRGRGCKLFVSLNALLAELRTDRAPMDAELGRLRADLESLGRRVTTIGKQHRSLSQNVYKFEKRQNLINQQNLAAIQAIHQLAHSVTVDQS